MTIVEKAVEWVKNMASDNSHGYDQAYRWGPDYDCSSLVISAYKYAGVPLTCTYTGNMLPDFLRNGFKDVTKSVNLKTGSGLVKGDVLLNVVHHTGMYIGDGKMVEASGNELGGITGGKTGDQTGREIAINTYHNYGSAGWDNVLRYSSTAETTDDAAASEGVEFYTVKSGDSLWSIAEKMLGNGARYPEIQKANNMTNAFIYPGEVIRIPSKSGSPDLVAVAEPKEETGGTTESKETGVAKMPELKNGAKSKSVKILQYALNLFSVKPKLELDGEFGPNTEKALRAFQQKYKLEETGTTTVATWEKIFSK